MIERVGILLEEAKVDPNMVLPMEDKTYKALSMWLSEYEEFLEHLKETTEETIDAIKTVVVEEECFCGERDGDEETLDFAEYDDAEEDY